MHINRLSCQATQSTAATMFRIATGVRNSSIRAVVNSLLVKQVPPLSSLSSADYYSSAIALRERNENLSFTNRNRNPTYTSPGSAPFLDVSAGGGPRPKTPRVWRTKNKRGSVAKSEKLIDLVNKLSNTKEEVYGALDAWIAWDLEFPLIAVKKALKTLKDEEDWRRIIQVSKWMLDKGQGKTLATYQLLLQAFDHEGRIEEAEVLWEKCLRDNLECIPRSMFAQMIAMYDRHGKKKELLQVFANMEELQVRPDPGTVERVARTYSHFGYHEVAQTVLERKNSWDKEFSHPKGKRTEKKSQTFRDKAERVEDQERPGSRNNSKSQKHSATNINSMERPRSDTSHYQEEGPRVETSREPQELPRLETSNQLEKRQNCVTNVLHDTSKRESNTELKERPRFGTDTKVKNDRDLTPTLT